MSSRKDGAHPRRVGQPSPYPSRRYRKTRPRRSVTQFSVMTRCLPGMPPTFAARVPSVRLCCTNIPAHNLSPFLPPLLLDSIALCLPPRSYLISDPLLLVYVCF